MKRTATALVVLVVAAAIAPAAAGTGQASGEAYAGTHVSFDASGAAVTDYAVDGETMLSSVQVQSQSDIEGGLVDAGASVAAVTGLRGAGVSVAAETNAQIRVEAENGATMTAHDNERGILVVASGDQSDYVVANLSTAAEAAAESDSEVKVTTGNGTEGAFLVVGGGNVTVNDDGDVTARLAADGRLVFRSYPDGKDDADDEQERLVAEGTAKAETYVTADENGNGTVVDTVSYDDDTTLAANRTAEGVEITVERATHEGTVVLASASDRALNATDDLRVTVDGEAAVEAATYTQLESAIGSEQSRYLVESGAEGSADVLVAVNHFSERTVAMSSAESTDETTAETTTAGSTDGTETRASEETSETTAETTDDGAGDEALEDGTAEDDTSGTVPGFTPATAVVALLAAALFARLR